MAARGPAGAERVGGTAEATGLADASVDAVVVGDAWHWFDAPAAAAEVHRVLRPRGRLALVWRGSIPEERPAELLPYYALLHGARGRTTRRSPPTRPREAARRCAVPPPRLRAAAARSEVRFLHPDRCRGPAGRSRLGLLRRTRCPSARRFLAELRRDARRRGPRRGALRGRGLAHHAPPLTPRPRIPCAVGLPCEVIRHTGWPSGPLPRSALKRRRARAERSGAAAGELERRGQVRGQRRGASRRGSPVTGWAKASRAACRNWRSSPSGMRPGRRRTPGRRRPGGRSPAGARGSGGCARCRGAPAAACAAAAPPRARSGCGPPCGASVSVELRVRTVRSRPIGASIVPERAGGRPSTSAQVLARDLAARRAAPSAPGAPPRTSRPRAGPRCRGRAGARARRARRPRRRRRGRRAPGPASRSDGPRAGWTTTPAGLSTTSRCSSS